MLDYAKAKTVNCIDLAKRFGAVVTRGNYCKCIFHNDKTPSMWLHNDHYFCFGCGAYGDAVTMVKSKFNCSASAALKWLAREYNLAPAAHNKNLPSFSIRKQAELQERTLYHDYQLAERNIPLPFRLEEHKQQFRRQWQYLTTEQRSEIATGIEAASMKVQTALCSGELIKQLRELRLQQNRLDKIRNYIWEKIVNGTNETGDNQFPKY